MKVLFSISTVLLAAAIPIFGQSAFQNLDFESASVVFIDPPIGIDAASALPGWTAYYGTSQLATIPYNNGGYVGLEQNNSLVLDGNFSVSLGGGSISQTALIPPDAKSLFCEVSFSGFAAPPSVFLDGQRLSTTTVSVLSGPENFTLLLGSDISAFAGQTATLNFGGIGLLDDVQFSPSLIPEPSPSWLLFVGGGVLIYLLRRDQLVRP